MRKVLIVVVEDDVQTESHELTPEQAQRIAAVFHEMGTAAKRTAAQMRTDAEEYFNRYTDLASEAGYQESAAATYDLLGDILEE